MMSHLSSVLLISLAAASTLATAQTSDLPNSLSGRWAWVERGLGQTFSLDEIKAKPDQTFTATLTWWTIDPKCAIHGAALTGKLTTAGLAFDAKTKCDVPFTAELVRGPTGWTGKATATGVNTVVLELKAN